jgi:fructose transport system substrate-binding protein
MRIDVMNRAETDRRQWLRRLLLAGTIAVLTACSGGEEPVTIGLITKQETNPYWVTLREVAEETAEDDAVHLLIATGSSDVDVDSQRTALRDMVAAGARGILIAPTDSTALVPIIEAIRKQGVVVIAVDTPVKPLDAVDAYYGTDNEAAGRLIGEYAAAKAAELGLKPKIAMLDLAPGISSGAARHKGFLEGFGITEADDALVAMADTQGNRALGEARMAEILVKHPDVNVVYTVNERAALGAVTALKAANVDLGKTIVVSIDGGCHAIKDAVRPGDIDATAMQFPENMAREGVLALARAARGGAPPSGYLDTGVELITGDPAPGVQSKNVAYGVRNCWGD